ncbi:MAG: tRNA uridine-5-carboxymethylaminomethyl(34) synthesis GTPase MnmE [Clostridiales Family XIII bacterium]|nr:tRNA uridine-5-carboxymethylaminomethyl(34) synthesis GTPase MnmE [Clostridiales Family XIII bacterium]
MERITEEDTIAAVATAYGEGGIGIVKLSGTGAEHILRKVFRKNAGRGSLKNAGIFEDRRLYYGRVADESGETVDEALAVFMRGPHTYTGEDVAEIDCHGSVIALRKTLALVLREGARLAEPGEFTKRGFLNGRIDLAQAEAVMDVVRAKTDAAHNASVAQLEGGLSAKIREIEKTLRGLLAEISVRAEYPEEDAEEFSFTDPAEVLSALKAEISQLISTAAAGKAVRDGLTAVIAGRPNVGKSSLLNRLAGEARAIVTEVPGTTRDTIEETVSVRGIPVNLVDTAGIRAADGIIEEMGIFRSWDALNRADLILFMLSAAAPAGAKDMEIARRIGEKAAIILLNKTDLPVCADISAVRRLLPKAELIEISVKENKGLNELESAIERMVYAGTVRQNESLLVTNARHAELLRQAFAKLEDAEGALRNDMPPELAELDLREAWECLGGVTGECAREDIIDEIFSGFCVGK